MSETAKLRERVRAAMGRLAARLRGETVVYEAKDQAKCRSCGAAIIWALTPSGRRMPLDPGLTKLGNIVLRDGMALVVVNSTGEPLFRSHFVTCPQASFWRGPRAPSPGAA